MFASPLFGVVAWTSGIACAASAMCEGDVIVQGDEGPVCGVAQVVDCHGVTVSHQEREEVEEQQEVEVEGEEHSRTTTHVHGWDS